MPQLLCGSAQRRSRESELLPLVPFDPTAVPARPVTSFKPPAGLVVSRAVPVPLELLGLPPLDGADAAPVEPLLVVELLAPPLVVSLVPLVPVDGVVPLVPVPLVDGVVVVPRVPVLRVDGVVLRLVPVSVDGLVAVPLVPVPSVDGLVVPLVAPPVGDGVVELPPVVDSTGIEAG